MTLEWTTSRDVDRAGVLKVLLVWSLFVGKSPAVGPACRAGRFPIPDPRWLTDDRSLMTVEWSTSRDVGWAGGVEDRAVMGAVFEEKSCPAGRTYGQDNRISSRRVDISRIVAGMAVVFEEKSCPAGRTYGQDNWISSRRVDISRIVAGMDVVCGEKSCPAGRTYGQADDR